jgi:hypothetical protein
VDRGMDMWGIEHARNCSGPVLDEDEARSLLQLKGAVDALRELCEASEFAAIRFGPKAARLIAAREKAARIDRSDFRPGDALGAFERAKVNDADPTTTQGAVADERQRIIERLLHAANLLDPDEVSRTAVTLEKMAMILTVEGGQ